MSGQKKLTLRIQSAEGTNRVEVSPSDVTATLFERVQSTLQLSSFAFTLHCDRGRSREIFSSKSRTLAEYNLQHGDMLYLNPVNGAVLFDQPSTSTEKIQNQNSTNSSAAPNVTTPVAGKPQEDDVDIELFKDPGKIQRQRDEKLCRHNSKGCCVHCSPLEPWDESYLKDHNIKHMSFHSYLRKLSAGKSFVSLDEPSYKIKPGCKEHPAWPRGICSACRPGDITLQRQPYRHVDNIVMENGAIVERFLAGWRAAGCQRAGLLFGRYERHGALPLAIRARVCAIYEPPQRTSRDHIELLPDENRHLVDLVAEGLGWKCVGWIFTDLLPDVSKVRGADSHFLSAQECITAGYLQNLHPNACRYATSGYYGSKFVTVCVTGDENKQVHLEGYQVSQQCAGLVRDNILLPTRDAPELGYIRESSPQQYVPSVQYKEKDTYGNEVVVRCGRVPLEYLLLDVPCGVASASGELAGVPLPAAPPAAVTSLPALQQHLASHADPLDALSDFHVLVFLATNATARVPEAELAGLLDGVRRRDADAVATWRASSDTWRTLLALSAAAASQAWTCPLCTYSNLPAAAHCDMCAEPRNTM